ncbi:MAG: ankyrin repeat domain-containing protein [Mariniphaga sp.]|nr:ankyrin repeat domain-containing protein [Mariniphaga sp.]MDD4225245.1 ankyrin repeat domain-containing protein [Mariniphaga sp.]MDD4425776.1 ankyrin repeat domain-containing protein [Mariniphaga sp.]
MKKLNHLVLFIFFFSTSLTFLRCGTEQANSEAGVTIHMNSRYQVIEGFGSCIVNYRDFPPEYADPGFFDRVVNDLGLSIVRVPLQEHTEWINDDDDPNHFNWNGFWLKDNIGNKGIETSMNLMNEFKKQGVKRFMGTPWSPPDFLKTNRSPVQGGYLRADMVDEFAEYLAAQIILAKKNYGIDLNWVSIQNELLFAQFYRSGVYQPWVLKEAVRAVMHKFEKEGITTKILMPEDMMYFDRMLYYIQPVMDDPETGNFNGHFSTHRHGGREELQRWVSETEKYNRQNWMTETSGHDQTWEGALKLANDIQDYLVYGNFSAWIYWQLSGGGDGKYSIMVNGKPGNKYYASKHFYRYIRPGAFRVEANTKHPGLSVSAFHDPYDGTLTLVLINNSDAPVETDLNNFTTLDIYRSDQSEQFVAEGKLKPGEKLTIPSKGIITLNGTHRKLKTGENRPELPEAWKIPEGAEEGSWGNSDPFPREIAFQPKPDGGNISRLPDMKQIDRQELIQTTLHNGWTWLHLSIMNGDGDAVKYLIESGADINAKANDGYTPLHMAASTFGDNVNKPNKVEEMTKYDIFRLVMNARPDLSAVSNDRLTPLHAAVINAYTGWRQDARHSLQRIEDLIKAGIDLEAKDKNGRTALHLACLQGYLRYSGVPSVSADVVNLLIDKGAATNAVDKNGKTPLHLAVEMGYPTITLAMVKAGADLSLKDNSGNTPESLAQKSGQQRLSFILKNKEMPGENQVTDASSAENTDNLKYGPELLKAAWEGNIQKVKELLDQGADVNYLDSDGFSALQRAKDNGHKEIVKLLEKEGE